MHGDEQIYLTPYCSRYFPLTFTRTLSTQEK